MCVYRCNEVQLHIHVCFGVRVRAVRSGSGQAAGQVVEDSVRRVTSGVLRATAGSVAGILRGVYRNQEQVDADIIRSFQHVAHPPKP